MSSVLSRRTTPLQNRLIALIQFLFFIMGLLLMVGGGARISIEFGRELFGINTERFKEGLANWTGETFTSLPVLAIAIVVFLVGYGLWWSAAALGAKTPPAWHAGRNGMIALLAALLVAIGLTIWVIDRLVLYVVPAAVIIGVLVVVLLVRFTQPDFRLNLGAERIQRTEPRRAWWLYLVAVVAVAALTVLGLVYAVLTDAIELPLPDVASGQLIYLTTFDAYNDEWSLSKSDYETDYSRVETDETGNNRLILSLKESVIPDDGFYTLLNRKFRDFDIRVTTTELESDIAHDNRYGIIFRYRDEKEYYAFQISGDGHYSLVKAVPDDSSPTGVSVITISVWIPTTHASDEQEPPYPTLIRPGNYNSIQEPLDAMNEIRVVGRDNKFWFYVNGEPLVFCLKGTRGNSMWVEFQGWCVEGNEATYVFEDDDYQQGQIGLFVGNTASSDFSAPISIAFDNVVILGPPSTIVVPSIELSPTP
ncbi:MAG: hypothetical protein H6673_15855 [Anaerolineales bacterium]|nr:hypothetical protein [Anaerolineales bacterium]